MYPHAIASVVNGTCWAFRERGNLPRFFNLNVRTIGELDFKWLERHSVHQGNDVRGVHVSRFLWQNRFARLPLYSSRLMRSQQVSHFRENILSRLSITVSPSGKFVAEAMLRGVLDNCTYKKKEVKTLWRSLARQRDEFFCHVASEITSFLIKSMEKLAA